MRCRICRVSRDQTNVWLVPFCSLTSFFGFVAISTEEKEGKFGAKGLHLSHNPREKLGTSLLVLDAEVWLL